MSEDALVSVYQRKNALLALLYDRGATGATADAVYVYVASTRLSRSELLSEETKRPTMIDRGPFGDQYVITPESCAYADAGPRRAFRRDWRDRYANATWAEL